MKTPDKCKPNDPTLHKESMCKDVIRDATRSNLVSKTELEGAIPSISATCKENHTFIITIGVIGDYQISTTGDQIKKIWRLR